MENLSLQRIAETVHGFGPYGRLLPRSTRRRLGRTPKKRDPVPTPYSGRHTTPRPATIRARPAIAMPTFYTRQATVYERELWKLEKEIFEKFDEAETTLHAAIFESLSQGTIRTINTQHAAGISSLTALQLVEVVHNLYPHPTGHHHSGK